MLLCSVASNQWPLLKQIFLLPCFFSITVKCSTTSYPIPRGPYLPVISTLHNATPCSKLHLHQLHLPHFHIPQPHSPVKRMLGWPHSQSRWPGNSASLQHSHCTKLLWLPTQPFYITTHFVISHSLWLLLYSPYANMPALMQDLIFLLQCCWRCKSYVTA